MRCRYRTGAALSSHITPTTPHLAIHNRPIHGIMLSVSIRQSIPDPERFYFTVPTDQPPSHITITTVTPRSNVQIRQAPPGHPLPFLNFIFLPSSQLPPRWMDGSQKLDSAHCQLARLPTRESCAERGITHSPSRVCALGRFDKRGEV